MIHSAILEQEVPTLFQLFWYPCFSLLLSNYCNFFTPTKARILIAPFICQRKFVLFSAFVHFAIHGINCSIIAHWGPLTPRPIFSNFHFPIRRHHNSISIAIFPLKAPVHRIRVFIAHFDIFLYVFPTNRIFCPQGKYHFIQIYFPMPIYEGLIWGHAFLAQAFAI